MAGISRRHLLRRLAALAAGAAGAGALAACSPAADQSQPEPLAATAAGPTSWPTIPQPASAGTIAPSPTPTVAPTLVPPPPRPDIIRFHPDVPSTIVHARHNAVWQGGKLVPGAIRQMLDASVTELTGLTDARAAWAALFRPQERVAIKVNVFQNSLVWTHLPLVTALTDSLQEAGLPPEQIVIYDNLTREFETAGYPVNQDGPGVRCYGSDRRHTAGFKVAGMPIKLSDVLLSCDALINVPVLKVHGMSGLSFALKNHYGTVNSPSSLHGYLNQCIAELNALPEIKDRTRLVIGDALGICLYGADSWPYWREEVPGDSILVSYDPVAVDTLGLRLFLEALSADGGGDDDAKYYQERANLWLKLAADLGVGTNEMENIRQVDLALA